MTTTLHLDEVTAFATAVRRELLDLGPDTLDELTDGLEADLAEKLADGEPLGDAAAYAAELRAAAGIEQAARSSFVADVRRNLGKLRQRVAPVLAHPIVAEVVSFVVALRPLWWVLRGWALFYLLAGFKVIPSNEWDYPVLAALVLLSIQWGRGRWLPWRWSRGAVVALSVIALLATPTLIGGFTDRVTFSDRFNPADFISDGLLLHQNPVTNIFAYGPDGQPLSDVQLFDQNGDPLQVVSDSWGIAFVYDQSLGDEDVLVPSDQVAGREGWNVYPLHSVPADSFSESTGELNSWAQRSQVIPPFASVQPLLGYEPPARPE